MNSKPGGSGSPRPDKPGASGKTVQKADESAREGDPRLPHERDESADSQHDEGHESMRQAYRDVESGLEDTDLRGSRGRREPAVPRGTSAPREGGGADKGREVPVDVGKKAGRND